MVTLKLIVSDEAYQKLMGSRCRVRGSIGMLSDREADFTAYDIAPQGGRKYMKLPHGRVSLSDESVRLTLTFGVDEDLPQGIDGSLRAEAEDSVGFVFDNLNN